MANVGNPSDPPPKRKGWWSVITENPAPTTAIVAAIVSVLTVAVNWYMARESFNRSIVLEIIKRQGPMCEVNERLTFLIAAKLLDANESITKAIGADSKCHPQKEN